MLGIFLIFVGVVYLLINAGMIPVETWSIIGGFWPIILILIGIQIILGRGEKQKIVMGVVTTMVLFAVLILAMERIGIALFQGWPLLKDINLNR